MDSSHPFHFMTLFLYYSPVELTLAVSNTPRCSCKDLEIVLQLYSCNKQFNQLKDQIIKAKLLHVMLGMSGS